MCLEMSYKTKREVQNDKSWKHSWQCAKSSYIVQISKKNFLDILTVFPIIGILNFSFCFVFAKRRPVLCLTCVVVQVLALLATDKKQKYYTTLYYRIKISVLMLLCCLFCIYCQFLRILCNVLVVLQMSQGLIITSKKTRTFFTRNYEFLFLFCFF